MLIAEITENNAGINISGDYEDLFRAEGSNQRPCRRQDKL